MHPIKNNSVSNRFAEINIYIYMGELSETQKSLFFFFSGKVVHMRVISNHYSPHLYSVDCILYKKCINQFFINYSKRAYRYSYFISNKRIIIHIGAFMVYYIIYT